MGSCPYSFAQTFMGASDFSKCNPVWGSLPLTGITFGIRTNIYYPNFYLDNVFDRPFYQEQDHQKTSLIRKPAFVFKAELISLFVINSTVNPRAHLNLFFFIDKSKPKPASCEPSYKAFSLSFLSSPNSNIQLQ